MTSPAVLTRSPWGNEGEVARAPEVRRKVRTGDVHRVVPDGHPGGLVVEHQLLGARHRREHRSLFAEVDAGQQIVLARRARLPKRFSPSEPEARERPRPRQGALRTPVEPRPGDEVLDARERPRAARALDAPPRLFAEPADEPEPQPQGGRVAVDASVDALERAVPVARVDPCGQHFDAVPLARPSRWCPASRSPSAGC